MQTKQVIEPEIPISTVSTTQTDYGSTTSTGNTVTAGQSRFSPRSERTKAASNNERDKASTSEAINPGFGYQRLSGSDIPARSDTGSRFPSFVNLPSTTTTGRFRFRPMENNSPKQTHVHISAKKTFLYSINVLNHVLIGFITIYMSWLCLRTGLAKTALHAWLVTIGFTLLMSEGIMAYYNTNVLTFTYYRDTKTTIHWSLQALGGSLGVIGALIKCFQKGFLLTSTHGKLGFAAMFLCLISMLSGLGALYSMRFKHLLSPLLSKTAHNVLGLITFIIAMITQFYGYKSGFFISQTNSDFQDLMKCITILSLALTCIGPLQALIHKIFMLYRQFAN